MNPAVKSKLVFSLMILFSILIMLQMGLYAAHQMWNFQLKWNLFQYCLSIMEKTSASHNIVMIGFNLLIFYTISRMIWRVMKQIYFSRKWASKFLTMNHKKQTEQLNTKYREWGTEFLVVENDGFIALTMGIFRPKIIVSTGLLHLFSDRETKAILLHEWHHSRNYDPLKVFISSLIVDGMGYIPIIKAAAHYYKTWKELLADQFAIREMGSVYDLGQVLLKLSNMAKTSRVGVGVYFADVAINYRIMQVLEPEKSIRVPFFQFPSVMFSLFVLFIMSSVVIGGCA
jgi:hypothetical protein